MENGVKFKKGDKIMRISELPNVKYTHLKIGDIVVVHSLNQHYYNSERDKIEIIKNGRLLPGNYNANFFKLIKRKIKLHKIVLT